MKRKIEEEGDGSERSSELGHRSDDRSRSGIDSGEAIGSQRSSSGGGGGGNAAAVGLVTSPTFSSLFSVTPTFSSSVSAVSLQQQKKAFRRHRRRLARIVTEQWKYAARSRILALKVSRVWNARARRNAFRHWKETAKHNAMIAREVDLMFPIFKSGRYFKIWKIFARISKRLRGCHLYFNQAYSATKRRNLLFTWRERADDRFRDDKQMCTAIHYHMISTLSRFFSNWKMARQAKHNKIFYRRVADEKWTFSRQRLALRAWKHYLALKQENEMLLGSRRRRILSKCFRFWHSSRKDHAASDSDSEVSVDFLLQEDMLLLVVDNHFKRKKQRHVFGAWSRLAKSRTSIKTSIDGFYRDKVLRNILRRSHQCWKEYYSSRKLAKAQRNRAVRYCTSYRLRSCFRWWRRYKDSKTSKRRRKNLASMHWKSNATRKTMLSWIDYCYCIKSRREKQDLVSKHLTISRLRSSIRRWIEFVSASKRKRSLIDRATDARIELVAGRGLSAWIDFVQTRKKRKMVLDEQFDELTNLLDSSRLANAWELWQKSVSNRRSKSSKYEKAEVFCRAHCARAALKAWHNLQSSRSSDHRAGGFYTKLLQRLALLGWFQVRKAKALVVSREPQQSQQSQSQQQSPDPVPVPSKEMTNKSLELLQKLGNDVKTCSNNNAGALARMRPAPRRTPAPLNDVRHNLASHSPAFDASSLSAQSGARDCLTGFPTKVDSDSSDPYQQYQKRVNGELLSRATVPLSLEFHEPPDAEFSHVIADEVAWMDHLLAGFEDLRAELVEKRAEFALILEKNTPGSRDKAQLLSQKISLLQQRRAILLPTIQAVASIVPGLRLRARRSISSIESSPTNTASFRRT